jgi:hypothetical protein
MSNTITGKDFSVSMVQAITAAWKAIQKRNADVPDVVVTFGAGSVRGGVVLGHFGPSRWENTEGSAHELFISGEGLIDGGASVMATLIHEAAHGHALATGVSDVSRGGRYHNGEFRKIADSMGITTSYSKSLGWSTSTISDEGRKMYAAAIKRLDAAISAHYRRLEADVINPAPKGAPTGTGTTTIGRGHGGRGTGRTSSNNGVSLACACPTPRRIRLAASVAELGSITCDLCGHIFH